MATPPSSPIASDWTEFVKQLGIALKKRRHGLFYSHGRYFERWHVVLIERLGSESTAGAIANHWPKEEDNVGRLLQQELTSVTAMLAGATGEKLPEDERLQIRKRGPLRQFVDFLKRPINIKEALKAGGTVMESLKELLEHAPPWLKALLTIGKEAVDTATG